MKELKNPLDWKNLIDLIQDELALNPSIATIERVIKEWGSPDQLETWEEERTVGGEFCEEGWLVKAAAEARKELVTKMIKAQNLCLMSGKASDLEKICELQANVGKKDISLKADIKGRFPTFEIVAGPSKKALEKPKKKELPQ